MVRLRFQVTEDLITTDIKIGQAGKMQDIEIVHSIEL